ncbi:hypothetical protein ACWD25_25370 [Streptomyces sp. NPDC002920]
MALFGKDNTELLHQILREIGELRERVTGQQQAIEQIRQDTTAALNTGLSENRAVVRDGLHRHQDTIGEPLARIGTELVTLRSAINDLGVPGHATPTTPADGHEPAPMADGLPDPDPNAELLLAAAGISHVTLEAHRDTWAFLVEHAAGDRHFHVPGAVDEDAGAISVRISGPSLVAALTTLDRVHRTDDDPGTRAIAGHLHGRLTQTVQDVIQRPHRGQGAGAVRIVIDDRIANDDNDQPQRDPGAPAPDPGPVDPPDGGQ